MEWIRLDDDRPEVYEPVLLYCPDGPHKIVTGYFYGGRIFFSQTGISPKVTHWMRFPDAPEIK